MEVNVKWGSHSFRGDPKIVYNEIFSLGTEVKPRQMVDYAQEHPESELYKCFTWDDDIAADRWRLAEARCIHGNLVITYSNPREEPKTPQTVRATFRTDILPSAGYKKTISIMSDDDEYEKLLTVAKYELRKFQKKYAILSELKEIFDLIERL